MQLLLDYLPADYAAWKAGFDAHAEARGAAGVRLLQIWRHAGSARVTCLFEVSDRARAEGWLAEEAALRGASDPRFVATA